LLVPDLAAADATAQQISALPQVSRAITSSNFIPPDQDARLKLVGDAAAKIGPSLSHPGTASMGKLMALSLVCTMAAAVLFQPVLMGPPRQKAK
jgi:hypothetical protein